MSADNRATGWKIPMAFCAVVAIAVGVTAYLRTDNTPIPPLPEPLMAQAQVITIDLNVTPEGRKWKEQISGTAGGFFTRAEKDIKIKTLVQTAIAEAHYDAACTAAVLMYNDYARDEVMITIADAAMAQCDTLPWAVLAAKGMKNKKNTVKTHTRLTEEWQRCQTKSTAN